MTEHIGITIPIVFINDSFELCISKTLPENPRSTVIGLKDTEYCGNSFQRNWCCVGGELKHNKL